MMVQGRLSQAAFLSDLDRDELHQRREPAEGSCAPGHRQYHCRNPFGLGIVFSLKFFTEDVRVNLAIRPDEAGQIHDRSGVLKEQLETAQSREGWLDVRVVMAIERALETGLPQKLKPLAARRLPRITQCRKLALADVPPFINTESPTE
jgi:hypothetical protein